MQFTLDDLYELLSEELHELWEETKYEKYATLFHYDNVDYFNVDLFNEMCLDYAYQLGIELD